MLCRANQWTGFNMITASAMKELMWQSKSVIDLQDLYELPHGDWFSQRFFFASLDFYISFRVELFSCIQTLRNFAGLNFRESWNLCVGCSLYILFTCALSLMEIEGFTAILPKLKSISQYDCHFTLSKNGIVLISN